MIKNTLIKFDQQLFQLYSKKIAQIIRVFLLFLNKGKMIF